MGRVKVVKCVATHGGSDALWGILADPFLLSLIFGGSI